MTNLYKTMRCGLKPVRRLKWKEWSSDFQASTEDFTKNQWGIADKYITGEDTFGEEAPQAIDPLMISQVKLMRYVWVARKFSHSRRRKELSFSHHEVVAALPPDKQDEWLDKCVKEKLTVQDLEDQSAEDRGVEGSGTPTLSDHLEMLLDKISFVRGKVPRDFTAELKLLDQANQKINLVIASVANREVGDPVLFEEEEKEKAPA